MSITPQAAIALQVRRVRRRLWVKNLLQGLLLGWTGAFILATLYFVVRSAVWGPGSEWVRWSMLGGSAGLGTIFALVWAIVRAPSPITSSLALDQRFALKECVTTSFSLTAKQAATPAGQAVLEDAHRKVGAVNVAERFPIGPRWKDAIVPVCSAILAVLALLFSPQFDFLGKSRLNAQTRGKVNDKAVQKQMDDLKKTVSQMDKKDAPQSQQMKDLEAELQKLLKKELDPKNEKQVRETIQEMQKLEDKMKQDLQDKKDLVQKSKDLRKTLEEIEKLEKRGKKLNPDGPAKDFQDALKKGDLKKAAEELDKLRKKLENKELGKEDLKKLTDQMQDLKDRIEQLRDEKQKDLQKEFEDRLQNLEDQNLKDELKKEFDDRLQKEMADEEDLKELEKMLGECKDGMDDDELAGKIKRLRGKLQLLDLDEDELRELLENCENLEEIRLGLLKACRGNGQGDIDLDLDMQGNGMSRKASKNPGGRRPVGEDPKDSKIVNQRQRGDVDPNSKMRIIGFSKGGVFKQVPANEIDGVFKQADQQSAETLDRQRIPSDAADVAKGYFKQLGGQK